MLKLIKENKFTYDDVDYATVDVESDSLQVLRYFEPEDEYQPKFSLSYNIAAALVDGKHDLSTFDEKKGKSKEAADCLQGSNALLSQTICTSTTLVFLKRVVIY